MLDELAVPRDQDLLDQVGVVDHDDLAVGEPDPDHVAIVPKAPVEEAEAVGRELLDVAAEATPLGAGDRARRCEGGCHPGIVPQAGVGVPARGGIHGSAALDLH